MLALILALAVLPNCNHCLIFYIDIQRKELSSILANSAHFLPIVKGFYQNRFYIFIYSRNLLSLPCFQAVLKVCWALSRRPTA